MERYVDSWMGMMGAARSVVQDALNVMTGLLSSRGQQVHTYSPRTTA